MSGWQLAKRGNILIERLEVVVISLKDINQGFWFHLGCWNITILVVKVSFRVHSIE